MCGEQKFRSTQMPTVVGSPPRVRGTAVRMGRLPNKSRITPACAGNSGVLQSRPLRSGDHPRVCGEQPHGGGNQLVIGGSPPRVRGTVFHVAAPLSHHRITPACAGNSAGKSGPVTRTQDHPRVCGEQISAKTREKSKTGSPPRVRGTVKRRCPYEHSRGITPACAGNSKLIGKSAGTS